MNRRISYLCDGAIYIRNAGKKIFPSSTIQLCRFHFWQTLEGKFKNKSLIPNLLKDEQIPARFRDSFNSIKSVNPNSKYHELIKVFRFDIKILERVPTQQLFLTWFQIIQPFWKKYAPEFYKYFSDNYVDLSKSDCYTGWQNCMKEYGPATNNSLEAFNRIIKEIMTDYKKLKFKDYVEAVFMELKRRSEESGAILQFPKLPIISNELLILAQFLSQRFDEYFETFDGNFFLKDKYPLCSIYNKKTGKFKQKLRTLALKVKENESEYGKKFLDFYKKPSANEIKTFQNGEIKLRNHFLSIICIHQVRLNIVEDSNEMTLLTSSCTCADHNSYRICIHLLATLISKKHFEVSVNFKKAKTRGRNSKVNRRVD